MAFFSRHVTPAKQEEPKTETPAEQTPAPAAAPVQQFVTLDVFKEFQDGLTRQLTEFGQQFGGARHQQQQQAAPAQEAPIDDVSDEEYAKAVENGGPGAAQIVNKRMAAMRERDRREFNAKISRLESTGLGALEDITRRDLAAKPHYDRYKKEIDGMLSALPADQRIKPEVQNIVYNSVVGQHMQEIFEDEKKKLLAAPPTATNDVAGTGRAQFSSAGGSSGSGGAAKITPEDYFGPDGMQALRFKGLTPEAYVQRQGYKDWADYIAQTEKYMQ